MDGTASATAPRSTPGRVLSRRYRAPLLAAIPLGVVVGVLAGFALSLQTVSASPEDRLPALFAYACIGAAFAVVAAVGATCGVLTVSKRAVAVTPFFRIAAGAGLAVMISVLLVGGILTALTHSWEWFPTITGIAAITGLIAGATASRTPAGFQYRDRLLP